MGIRITRALLFGVYIRAPGLETPIILESHAHPKYVPAIHNLDCSSHGIDVHSPSAQKDVLLSRGKRVRLSSILTGLAISE